VYGTGPSMKQLVKTVRAITIKIPVTNVRILFLSWAGSLLIDADEPPDRV